MKSLFRLFDLIGKKIKDDHVTAFSAQAAFFILLSFFPFLIFALTLVKFLPITADDLFKIILSIVPVNLQDYVNTIMMQIYYRSTTTIMSVSIITALWSASKSILSIKNGLNTVAGIEESRPYLIVRFVSMLYTFAMALSLITMVVVFVFGNRILHHMLGRKDWIRDLGQFISNNRVLFAVILLLFVFLLLYKVLPNKKESFLYCLPGAIFSTLGWLLLSFVLSIYIDNFSNFTIMYGSLAGVMFALLWMYFCMNIVFLGGELNYFLKYFFTIGNRYSTTESNQNNAAKS